jgi:hypothetical protein
MTPALLPVITRTLIPRRYIDYPAALLWLDPLTALSAFTGFAGLALLILLTMKALIRPNPAGKA